MQFAHLLKYLKHDTIPIGLRTTSDGTLKMLFEWADVIICTDDTQAVPDKYQAKYKLWNVGPDRYPRPFNHELLVMAKRIIAENPL